MRDMVTCFSEHAVRVSELTCSSSYANQSISSSVQNAVVSLYKTPLLSPQKLHFFITLTWSRTHLGQGSLSITFESSSSSSSSTSFQINPFSRLFRKKKGHKSFEINSNSKVQIIWDLSSATYSQSGPEPVDNYYVLVMVGPELGLALGDQAQEAAYKRLKMGPPLSKPAFQLVSRREHYSGPALYSTKAQFCDSGVTHEIVIRCGEEHDREKTKQPVLYVSIDKRPVIKIRRLQWNFRGNQTVFVDGLLVDLMWDVHNWFFNPGSGHAVFMFKTRSGPENRLWLEDKLGHKDQQITDFSLLIYASKSP